MMDCDCDYCADENCHDCGEYIYDCCCESEGEGQGHSPMAPWEARGISVKNVTSDSDWQSAWKYLGKNHLSFDPCQQAADFYLLEALTANVPALEGTGHIAKIPYVQKSDLKGLFDDLDIDKRLVTKAFTTGKSNVAKDVEHRIGLLMGEAEKELVKVVKHADKVLKDYFHMACAGEARHHQAIGGRILSGSSNRSAAWVGWKSIHEKIGNQALMDLYELFLEFTDGSYGGQPWADACEVLYERLEGTLGPDEFTNKKMFVDRAWTLEHNGGCFLNKIQWGVVNDKNWHLDYLQSHVLEAHAANPTNFKKLLKVASKKVVKLYNRYYELQNKYRKANGLELVTNWITEPPVTKQVCKRCGSNPERGHLMSCAGLKYDSTYTIDDEDDYHTLAAWDYEKYPVTTDKKLVPGKYKVSGWASAGNGLQGDYGWAKDVNFKPKTLTLADGDVLDITKMFNDNVESFAKKHKVETFPGETYITVYFNVSPADEYAEFTGHLEGPLYLVYEKGKLVNSTISYGGKASKKIGVGVEKNVVTKTTTPEIIYTYNLERKQLEPSKAKVITVESKVK